MVALLLRFRWPYLAVLLVITAWLGSHAARVDVERDNESLNTLDPRENQAYAAVLRDFGSDDDLIVAVADAALLTAEGLQRIARLTDAIAAIDGVEHVFSLTNAVQLVAGPDGAVDAPLLPRPWTNAGIADEARRALDRNPDFTGLLISADRKTAGVVVQLEHREHDVLYREQVIRGIRGLMDGERRDGVELHLSGVAVQKYDVGELVRRDQAVLVPIAIGILAVMLALSMRSLVGVVLPLAVMGVSVVWTLGLYGLCGLRVNAITALLPPILMVLTLTASAHLLHAWLRDEGATDVVARIDGIVRQLWFPCLYCALTSAFGFGSLATSDMPAVRQFGTFAAVGVAVSFLLAMTLVPIGLSFQAPPRHLDTRAHPLDRWLAGCGDLVTAYPRAIWIVFIAITALSLLGLPYLRNNTDLVGFLKSDAPLRRDTLFIDTHLTGVNSIDLVVQRRDGEPLVALDDVERLATLEAEARSQPHITSVTSILPILRQIERAERGDDTLRLPADEESLGYAFDLVDAAAPDQPLIRRVLTDDRTRARLSLRMRAIGTAEAEPILDHLERRGRQILGDAYELSISGPFVQVVRDSNRLVVSQVRSFASAMLLVFLAIGLLFRSLRWTFLSVIPNTIPILWTMGMMGALGIDLSTGTVMIASAVLGLIVDDTIHYLTQYDRVFRGDRAAAIREASRTIGRALVVNNFILIFGFWVGCFGSFKPTIYFSLLSGLTMITGLLCDLLITPLCLLTLDNRKHRP